MPERIKYAPNWVTCPGETLAEWFAYTKLPWSVCWKLHDISEETLAALLRGDEVLTEDLARKLMNLTFIPVPFWLAIEHNYRAGLGAGLVHEHPEGADT